VLKTTKLENITKTPKHGSNSTPPSRTRGLTLFVVVVVVAFKSNQQPLCGSCALEKKNVVFLI